jgi:cyclomaltodextrin glucanotransferase
LTRRRGSESPLVTLSLSKGVAAQPLSELVEEIAPCRFDKLSETEGPSTSSQGDENVRGASSAAWRSAKRKRCGRAEAKERSANMHYAAGFASLRLRLFAACGGLWMVSAVTLSGCGGSRSLPPVAPQSADYRSRTVYFIVADRFNPHAPYTPYVDPAYPDATNTVNCFSTPCTQEAEFRKYWGGDVRGIIQRISYLHDLGISAVWVTPLMENVRDFGTIGAPYYGAGYHGYWVQNYYRVNAHFGTWNDVDALGVSLHAAGMRYIQDITLNHSNPLDAHAFGALYQSAQADQPFITSYADDFNPTLPNSRYYKHYQSDPQCMNAPPNDADWTYWQLHHCLLADLSGYNQLDPAVAQYLVAAGERWLDHGVDDFRLDAIKFVFPEFVPLYTRAMTDHSAALGRPAPYIVGEWSNGGVGDAKSLQFANDYQLNGVNILDFQLSYALNRFIGGSYEATSERVDGVALNAFLKQRVAAFNGRDDWQGTFIDNHDQIRTLVRLKKLGDGNEGDRERRMDLATVLLLTVRGIPIVMYGDEQYLAFDDPYQIPPTSINTGNDDPYNRVGMMQWREDTSNFLIVRALAQLRARHPAIWKGTYATIYADADTLIYLRSSGSDIVYVAVNRGPARKIVVTHGLALAPGTYRGLFAGTNSPNALDYLTVSASSATFSLAALSALVVTQNESNAQL